MESKYIDKTIVIVVIFQLPNCFYIYPGIKYTSLVDVSCAICIHFYFDYQLKTSLSSFNIEFNPKLPPRLANKL